MADKGGDRIMELKNRSQYLATKISRSVNLDKAFFNAS